MLQPRSRRESMEQRVLLYSVFICGIVSCLSRDHGAAIKQSPGSPPSLAMRVRAGFEDFKEMLLLSDAFVDKSMLIKDILEEFSKTIVIARPRKWGKTVNMNMIKRFFEIETDFHGLPVKESARVNNRLFHGGSVDLGTDGKHNFKTLKISNYTKLVETHMGRYPVIYWSMKPVKGYGMNRILNMIKVQLMKLYKNHAHLRQSLTDDERHRFDRYTVSNITEWDVKDGLKFLSELLYKRCNKEVIILIDDYDTPIISSYWELMENEKELDEVIKLFRDFYAVTVNNPFVHKAIVTGLVLFDRTNLFMNINSSVAEYSLHNKKYSQHFGFTGTEVDDLLSEVSVSLPPSEIKRYYNGFAWSENNQFNPHSIMECLVHDGDLDQYWIDSESSLTIDVRVFKGTLTKELPLLEDKGIFVYKIYEEINFMDIFEGFREMWLSLLVMAGYLDVADDVDRGGDYGHRLWIPNQEIRDKFVPKVLKWWLIDDGDAMISINL